MNSDKNNKVFISTHIIVSISQVYIQIKLYQVLINII